MRKTCSICSGAMALARLDTSGSDGTVTITVHGMPTRRCQRGHAQPADDDFMLWLIRELKERAAGVPAGSESGVLFFHRSRCPCGNELAKRAPRSQVFPFELAYKELPAFKVELEVPLYKCSGCGRELARSRDSVRSHATRSVARLHDAAGFPHHG
jgi:hypothetical protein